MNIEMILNSLNAYNEHERFYQEYYDKKKNPDEFARFLHSLDPQFVRDSYLVVPELSAFGNPGETPLQEDYYFKMSPQKSIYLTKHNRCTPPFEHTHTFFEIIYVLRGTCQNTISGTECRMQEGEYADRLISTMLMIFFAKVVRKYKDTAESPMYGTNNLYQSSRLISCIQEDYRTISLSRLADKLGYSVPYCSRYIKSVTGFTFQQLLKQVRFQKAETLLTNTALSIQAISERLGYENPEGFIRLFREEYGMTPNHYRQKHS
ncbi:MAG: helix-turn-helix domain-containing protein [Lachnospiraceae bacterium]|nr:helix-turn-helix domain-containing protein [Lachnospiraceae bacterium]